MTIASKPVRRSYYYYYYPDYYKEKERKVNFRTRFFLMLANEFLAFEHSPLFFVDIIIHCSLLRTCRVRVEEKEEFLVYTVLWTLTCHPYLESATALSDDVTDMQITSYIQLCTQHVHGVCTCTWSVYMTWRVVTSPFRQELKLILRK